MKILAVDPGTKCGWAIGELGCVPTCGTFNLTPDRWTSLGARVIRLKQLLEQFFDSGLDLVVYEEVRGHKGVDAAHVYGAIVSAIQEMCLKWKVPFESIPVGTIKKFATGKGNSNKEAMMEAARARGWVIEDDNQADALFMLAYRLKG